MTELAAALDDPSAVPLARPADPAALLADLSRLADLIRATAGDGRPDPPQHLAPRGGQGVGKGRRADTPRKSGSCPED